MEGDSINAGDRRRIERRLSNIERRLNELSELWRFAADSDAHYRMIEAEREALRTEREKLKEIRGDL